MPIAISPYRYYQVAHYLLRRIIDQTAFLNNPSWKGKGKALSIPSMNSLLKSTAMEARRTWDDMVPSESYAETSISGANRGGKGVYLPPKKDEEPPKFTKDRSEIHRLMNDERLLDPKSVKPPREVVVLCHGLYGFSTATPIPLFPSLKLHYWASVLEVLRDQMGVNVLVVGVKGTGSVKERAEQMHQFLKEKLPKGTGVNFVAHSMGGLDCRYLISNLKPTSYTPLSLTTIGTPHRGSPFMDWCAANIGVGSIATAAAASAISSAASVASAAAGIKNLPYSLKSPILSRPAEELEKVKKESGFGAFTTALTSYLLNIFDSPAYSNLTTAYLRDTFNPHTPDSPNVKYTSVAGKITKLSVLHPLWFPKLVLDAAAENGYGQEVDPDGGRYEGNDGLVSVYSSKWGEYLGAVDETHHWDLRGEGGLFPNTSSLIDSDNEKKAVGKDGNSKEEKIEEGAIGSNWAWDWQGDFGNGISEHLGLAAEVAKNKASEAVEIIKNATPALSATKAPPSTSPNNKPSSTSSSWDLAQVGQIVEWVTDLVPGGDNVETKKKQIADAKREKEKEKEKYNGLKFEKYRNEEVVKSERKSEGIEKDRIAEREKERKKKEKFELGRFYGGLMLKLRDDGF